MIMAKFNQLCRKIIFQVCLFPQFMQCSASVQIFLDVELSK